MKKKAFIIVFAIFITICMSVGADQNMEKIFATESASVFNVAFAILIYYLLEQCNKQKDKRLKICAAILACLLATMEIVGYSINTYLDLSGIINSPIAIVKNAMKWIGYSTVFYLCIVLLFSYCNQFLERIKEKGKKNCKTKELLFFTNNKRSFLIVMLIILLAWLPYLLKYFPGNATSDSMSQVLQALGITKLNNHHPVIHTAVIWIGMTIGKVVGNYNAGMAVYSIIQMCIMAAIFSFAIYYMAKRHLPVIVRVLSLIFFACYPINALYSITMWKDVIFSGMVVLFVIGIVEIITNQNAFFKRKINSVLFIFISILMILFRNNGIYMAILTMPFLFIIVKQYRKQLLIICFIILAIYSIVKGPVFSMFDIKGASIREALSIPLQQFARVMATKESVPEKEEIYCFLPIDDYKQLYSPIISDPIKAKFNENYFKEHKFEFIKLWVKIVFEYPREALESFLCNSYGYWYPEAKNWVVSREIYQGKVDGDTEMPISIYQEPLIKGNLVSKIDSLIEKRNIPILSMGFSIGFAFWITIISCMYLIYKKRYKELVAYLPILVLWLTCIASPVYCEYRYIYSMFITLPILTSIALISDTEKNEGDNL